ncbi:hypothetical protein GCG54_00000033 [Colletotrichum gloeosporioides]|uniref:CCHC-type domain-containing protein n=1 Tax=Colletotrichum gloeosporioides TaxID=474922 RepID=A0A8H4CP63_COLGL|nr:uncharacterized protein GCG54_00000033 [Colletotrichum gloeosporioides]KAF3807504.1 hypothetical protein GCG54_00000033 [Colletotrichum gloeosporioides]
MQTLPEPANGDIFAFGGKLTIDNAAANVFIIHDTRPGGTALLPSSLSVGFVLENVYHIDAALFSRYCSTLVGGTLIKGLGLQAEGCHLGDRSIDTVYDDIVCVVSDQAGSSCSIGSVAGDFVAVIDPVNDWKDPELSPNLTITHVAGQSTKESLRAEEGSLARALSTWSSMKFAPSQPGVGHTPAIVMGTDLGADKNTFMPSRPFSGSLQASPRENVEAQLLKALSELDEARQELASWKQQSLGPHHELALPKVEISHPENLALTESEDKQLPATVPLAMICGNCDRPGHEVRDCIGPVDNRGFIDACPLCNTRAHGFDQCPKVPSGRGSKSSRKSIRFEYLVLLRSKKAPIKSHSCWIAIWVHAGMPFIPLPHTKHFSLKLSQDLSSAAYNAPDWRTYEYNGQISIPFDKLVQDPDTVLQKGLTCQLVPGSQSSLDIAQSHCSIKNKMQRTQIKNESAYPAKHDHAQPKKQPKPQRKKQGASKQLKKSKKKQYARHLLYEEESKDKIKRESGGIPSFATGANCTMLQRPLPTLPAREHVPFIKQEPVDY